MRKLSKSTNELTKRTIDVVLATLGLAGTAPIQAWIALGILRSMGRPVLFRQERVGLGGRPFVLAKFRTMTDLTGPGGELLTHEQRLTQVGRRLRAASLDELPTLISVLRGDMSLVGPRPLLPKYLDRYTPRQARRHEVKPGITGWAQVHGRNSIGWEEKFELDVWYVDNGSITLDFKILWMTIARVLRREGISADGYAIMPEFKGTPRRVEKQNP